MKFYEARFAPNAETWRDAIRVSQNVVQDGETIYECFQPQAFRDAGVRASDVPILLDHDHSKRAGTATALITHSDWHIASFVLDGPYAPRAAEWIERSGRVSPGFDAIDSDPVMATRTSPHHPAYHWRTRAKLNEISIVGPGAMAWYAGAKVTAVREFKAPMAPTPNTRRVRPYPPTKRTHAVVPAAHGSAARELGRRRVGRDLVIDMADGSEVIYGGAGWKLPRTSSERVIRREGDDYVIDHEDGSSTIYSAGGYQEALRDGTLRVR